MSNAGVSAITWHLQKIFHIKIWRKLRADEQLPVLETGGVCDHDLLWLKWKGSRRVQGQPGLQKYIANTKTKVLGCLAFLRRRTEKVGGLGSCCPRDNCFGVWMKTSL